MFPSAEAKLFLLYYKYHYSQEFNIDLFTKLLNHNRLNQWRTLQSMGDDNALFYVTAKDNICFTFAFLTLLKID